VDRLDDPQAWRDDHPDLSAALPTPGEVISLSEGERALWLRMPEPPEGLRCRVWLGLGDAAGYVLTRHDAGGLDRRHLLRHPRQAVQAAFEPRAPAWFRSGEDGCYGTFNADFDWVEFTSRDELLAFCQVAPGDPGHAELSSAEYVPGLSVVAHVPGTGQAVWSDGHHSGHLHDADSPRVVTGACLKFLELIEPERVVCPRRLDVLPHYAGLRAGPEFTPNPAAAPPQADGAAGGWGHLTLAWRSRTEVLPARAVASEGDDGLFDYDFWFRVGDTWTRNVWPWDAAGPERRPGVPFQVRLDDGHLEPEDRTPQVTPTFLWPHSVTDLHLVLMWLQRLEERLFIRRFSTTVLPSTFVHVLVEAYGATVVPENPAIPLTVVDTDQHWEGGFDQFCQDALSGVLNDAGLVAELESRRLFRAGLGPLLLRGAAQDAGAGTPTKEEVLAHAQHWAAWVATQGDTLRQWVTYLNEDPPFDLDGEEVP
jgi:hypothetical protein